MPRNGSGTFTLVSGNPVVTGTTIESTWANTTLSDIATTLTDSLSRSGQGGMTAALRIADGTQGAPGLGFANETGSGLYRAGTGEVWAVVQGAQTMNLDANGVTVPSDKATSIEGTFVFNETGADKDARFEGDTDANLLFVDASADAVGIGTSSPGVKLEVSSTSAGATVETLRLSNPGAGANTQAQIKFFTTSTNYGTISGGYGASAPQMTFDLPNGTPGNYVWQISSSEKMRLDSSGNLGLGVTPSAWSGIGKTLQVNTGGSFSADAANAYFAANSYYNGTNWIYQTTNNATRYTLANNSHIWYTAPSGTAGNAISFTQAMTLDASGNLDIGTTGGVDRYQNIIATSAKLTFNAGTGFTGSAATSIYNQSAIAMVFGTNNTERARITSGGDLLVGTTTAYARLAVVGDGGAVISGINSSGTAVNSCINAWNQATSGDNVFMRFETEGTSTARGSIDYNRAGGLVRYNTTSDYRAKDIIGPVQNVGATIDALKVYEGVMKGATQSRPMLIAHEAQEHAPYAVSGVKDEVNEDGTPKLQQMDVSSLVPLLLAEIQSLRARVAALEAQ